MLGDCKQILGAGEEIYSNNKLRYKRLWKFLVHYGISRQPIVGTCNPAPTLLSIFLLCTLLAEHTQTHCSEREEERRKKRGERRRGEVLILSNWRGNPVRVDLQETKDKVYSIFSQLSWDWQPAESQGLTDLTEGCHPLPTSLIAHNTHF